MKKRYEYVLIPKPGYAFLLEKDIKETFPETIVVRDQIGFPVWFKMGEMKTIRSLIMSFKVGKILSKRFMKSDSVSIMRREIKPNV